MATPADNRWKAILGMSSDHAGINQELGRLRAELYRVLARIDDARDVRDYLEAMRRESGIWFDSLQARKSDK